MDRISGNHGAAAGPLPGCRNEEQFGTSPSHRTPDAHPIRLV